MCVSMCLRMYVCQYMYAYVCVPWYVHACTNNVHACMYMYTKKNSCLCMYVTAFSCIHVNAQENNCVCIYVSWYVHACINNVYACIDMHKKTTACVCMCAIICSYIHIYTQEDKTRLYVYVYVHACMQNFLPSYENNCMHMYVCQHMIINACACSFMYACVSGYDVCMVPLLLCYACVHLFIGKMTLIINKHERIHYAYIHIGWSMCTKTSMQTRLYVYHI